MVLHLENVDHAAFGLFLKFIYQGSYPASVDILSAMARSRTHASPYVNAASQLGSSIQPSLISRDPVIPASVHGKFPDCVSRLLHMNERNIADIFAQHISSANASAQRRS
jgi:hypothetical protein